METRRMFRFPRDLWRDPESGGFRTLQGTSDLDWCTRAMEGGYFAKAGWEDFDGDPYPFLVDTSILCGHIDLLSGDIYP